MQAKKMIADILSDGKEVFSKDIDVAARGRNFYENSQGCKSRIWRKAEIQVWRRASEDLLDGINIGVAKQ